jgi:hypothetical protein
MIDTKLLEQMKKESAAQPSHMWTEKENEDIKQLIVNDISIDTVVANLKSLSFKNRKVSAVRLKYNRIKSNLKHEEKNR